MVDHERCKRDGICIAECPAQIIEFKDKGAFPTIIRGGDEYCIKCGHCVAVCPHGAMSHAIMKPEDCPPLRNEWALGPQQVEHLLRARRSIRNYKKKHVTRDVLTRLIDIARYAPSGHNQQPVNWIVIYDSDEVRRLAGMVIDLMRHLINEKSPLAAIFPFDRIVAAWDSGEDRICRGAPHLILTHAHKDDATAISASTIAPAYLDIAAPSFGLGTCWAGYVTSAAIFWPPMHEALGLPEEDLIYGAMMIGFPKFKYHRLPKRNDARITWR
ncbi:MAG: nitroreductase family protein [Thermodesulfobacteriota bacterium]|nr:nitroreductase family protein [Thermodesulfobacteriota bacterium]